MGYCRETRNRIRVALYAYAYEVESDPIVSDQVFDELCDEIDLTYFTGNEEMDLWFINNFEPYTGSWVHRHPGINRLKEIYNSIKQNGSNIILEDLF